jgi:hypothetical protein
MLFAWILPSPSHDVVFEGWRRTPYRPKHGKLPLLLRALLAAVTVVAAVGERYLGVSEDEGITARPVT